MMRAIDPNQVSFNEQGLVPAIVQDQSSKEVLMMAWMNADSLSETIDGGELVFFSRSRNTRWKKGETSGNIMRVSESFMDCDSDTLLFLVQPAGPACHNGTTSCFEEPNA